jgi:hypothetical protein
MFLSAYIRHARPWRIDPYTRPIPGWMKECKQKPAPIFVLVE